MTYFNQHLDGKNLKEAVEAARERLAKVEFDTIACRGNSGLLFASALGMVMEKKILIVRKATDNSHSQNSVEGERMGTTKILIVDDFISTGETMKEIHAKVSDAISDTVEFVGIYLYGRTWALDRKFSFTEYWASIQDVTKLVKVMTAGSKSVRNLNEANWA